MKAIEILALLDNASALPRGINIHSGDVFQNSFDRYIEHLQKGEVNFSLNKDYVEFRRESIPELLWRRLEENDGFAVYDFGEYRYLVVE